MPMRVTIYQVNGILEGRREACLVAVLTVARTRILLRAVADEHAHFGVARRMGLLVVLCESVDAAQMSRAGDAMTL